MNSANAADEIKVIDNTLTIHPLCHFKVIRHSFLKMTIIISIVPATRRTNLSAVSSCSTESGCCFCQSSRETRSYSMLMTRPRPPRCEDPLQSLAAITIRTLHLSQSWPRSHDLVTYYLLSSAAWCAAVHCLSASGHSVSPNIGPWSRHSDFPRLSPSPVVTAAGSAHSQNCRKQTTLGKLSGRFPLISLVTGHRRTFHWSLGVTSHHFCCSQTKLTF